MYRDSSPKAFRNRLLIKEWMGALRAKNKLFYFLKHNT